jgi:hypothetical protein
MLTEREVQRFLKEECYTTPETKDPRKPLILDGEFVKPNPDFDPALLERESIEREIKRRKNRLGTSFFLNFDPLCNLHQIDGHVGDMARRDIARSLHERFIEVFVTQFPDNPPPVEELASRLRVAICPHLQPGFNNGEVYLWLPGIPLNEDFVFKMMRSLRSSLEENPISVFVEDKDYEVLFYGWGFRYY